MKKQKLANEEKTPGGASCTSGAAADSLRSNGTVSIRATGSSMIPSIWPGEILLVRRIKIAEVSAGDVVLAARGEKLIAHRVVEIRDAEPSARIVTRGESLTEKDPEISEAELLGRVAAVYRDGEWHKVKTQPGLGTRMLTAIVRRSSFTARVLLHFHAKRVRRVGPNAAIEFSATWGI